MIKRDISIIIPCFNEGPTFKKSVNSVISTLTKSKYSWEIIFVEDKSEDTTKIRVESLVKKFKNARALFHHKNLGRGKSVTDGLLTAKGKICGYLDIDLEVSDSYIPLFVDEVKNGKDLVVGKRFYEARLSSLSRFLASKVYSLLVKHFLNIPISDTEAGYKFFNRDKILPILKETKDKHWFWDTEICARTYQAGLEISEIPVLFVRRKDKKSTVRLIPDTIDYLSAIINFRREN